MDSSSLPIWLIDIKPIYESTIVITNVHSLVSFPIAKPFSIIATRITISLNRSILIAYYPWN